MFFDLFNFMAIKIFNRDEWSETSADPKARGINQIFKINFMKKLSLEMLRLTSDEVLERSQMKKITGGYGGSYVGCEGWSRNMYVGTCNASVVRFYCGPNTGGWCT